MQAIYFKISSQIINKCMQSNPVCGSATQLWSIDASQLHVAICQSNIAQFFLDGCIPIACDDLPVKYSPCFSSTSIFCVKMIKMSMIEVESINFKCLRFEILTLYHGCIQVSNSNQCNERFN